MPGTLKTDEPIARGDHAHEESSTNSLPHERIQGSQYSASQTLDSPPMFEDSLSDESSARSAAIRHVNLQDSQSSSDGDQQRISRNQSISPHSPSSPDWSPEDTVRFLNFVHQGMTLRQVHRFFPDRSEVELWQYLGVCWRDGMFRVGEESSVRGGTPAQALAMAGMAGRSNDPVDYGLARAVAEVMLDDILENHTSTQHLEELGAAVETGMEKTNRSVESPSCHNGNVEEDHEEVAPARGA